MAERVYPSTKPASAAFPATKAQLYNASRPSYRPLPPPRRTCRKCCLYTTFSLLLLLLLSAAFSATLYLLYSPRRPSFSLSSLSLSHFNLSSSSSHLSSNLSLSLLAHNPNKKLSFDYSPFKISLATHSGIPLGDSSFPSFIHSTRNTTLLKTNIAYNSQIEDAGLLKGELKRNKGVRLKIEMDTRVRVRIGKMKTKRVGVRVTCGGVTVPVPTGKAAVVKKGRCDVDFRVKIWKWTI